MNDVIFYGELNGFLKVEKNDKLILKKDEDNNFKLATTYGVTIIHNTLFNQTIEKMEQMLSNKQEFIVNEVCGNAVIGSLA